MARKTENKNKKKSHINLEFKPGTFFAIAGITALSTK